MRKFLLLAAVGVCLVIASSNYSEARHRRRVIVSTPYRYYMQPPVVYDPFFVAPPPIVIHRPVYPVPVYRVPTRPVFFPRRVRYGPREVEVKYKRTRYGYRIEYDIDD